MYRTLGRDVVQMKKKPVARFNYIWCLIERCRKASDYGIQELISDGEARHDVHH